MKAISRYSLCFLTLRTIEFYTLLYKYLYIDDHWHFVVSLNSSRKSPSRCKVVVYDVRIWLKIWYIDNVISMLFWWDWQHNLNVVSTSGKWRWLHLRHFFSSLIQRHEGDFTKLVQRLTNIILSNGKNYQLWPGHWKHNDFPKQFLKSRILEEKLGQSRNIGQFLPKSRKSRNVQKK